MSGISNQAILVDLNLSVWTGRRRDKTASDEVVATNHAKSKQAARVIKSLFADEPKLAAIVNQAQNTRLWHYANTLPWADSGARLLPMKNFLDYKRTLREHEAKFDAAVQDFLTDYSTLVSAAAFKLGDLFSRMEYPTAQDIRRKFGFNCTFSPVPESGDFRVTTQDEELDELKQQYETNLQNRIADAAADTWRRLYECLQRMSTQLGFDQGKKKRIHDSLFTGARELSNLLGSLNITGDPALDTARKQLEGILYQGIAEDVRKHENVRSKVKQDVDAVLSAYDSKFIKGEEDEATQELATGGGELGAPALAESVGEELETGAADYPALQPAGLPQPVGSSSFLDF